MRTIVRIRIRSFVFSSRICMPPQLTRLIIIFGFLALAFFVGRRLARPDSFYEYGHYRGKALTELSERAPKYVPRKVCADCHDQEAAQNAAGPHAKISCQTCHGPGNLHVDDPQKSNIIHPNVVATCTRCHLENKARPSKFPQIAIPDHNDGKSCNKCHTVHNPLDIH